MYKKRFVEDRCSYISAKKYPLKPLPSSHKGQVTIFIILGIILVLAIAIVIALKTEVIKIKPEELIPTEKGKVETFLTTCIEQIGNDALYRMGQQGGYIDVPTEITNDGTLHLRTSPITVVPYWAYGTNTRIPSLDDLKFRLDRHMEQNLHNCLFSQPVFREKYDVLEKSDIRADTKLLDSQTIFDVHWDVELRNKAGEVITEVLDHRAESKIKLKRVYQTAKRITEAEMRDLKLEDLTQDLIALEHPDLPLSNIEFSCSKKRWKVSTVRQTLKDLLRVNLRELRISGTEYVEFPETLPYYQNHYIWNLGDEVTTPDVSTQFSFEDNYPFVFNVGPRQGSTLTSGQMGGTNKYLSTLCLQTWKFVYDASYPVVATIRDDTTRYNFKIAMTVHLVNNIPNRDEAYTERPNFVPETISDDEFCQGARIPMTISTYEVIDNSKGVHYTEVLENVNIASICLRYECEHGTTEYSYAEGNVATLASSFPYCVGAIIKGTKSGYKESWKRVVTRNNEQVRLELAPLLTVPAAKIKILKHELFDDGDVGLGKELASDEMALLKITHYRSDSPEPFHESSLSLQPGADSLVIREQSLELLAKADFTYDLDISVLRGDPLETQSADYVGGYKGNWTPRWFSLEDADELVFHIISKDKASEDEQQDLLLDITAHSQRAPLPELNVKPVKRT